MDVRVLPHALKHGLSVDEVQQAWQSPLRSRLRGGQDEPQKWIAIGVTIDGKLVEMVAFQDVYGTWCVFHAMAPPTKKFQRELGMLRR